MTTDTQIVRASDAQLVMREATGEDADTCAAIGCGSNIPDGASFTTVELKSNFLSSARVGERVVCRCTPAHLGRQIHVWDAVVENETTARTMALFRCTQMVLHPR